MTVFQFIDDDPSGQHTPENPRAGDRSGLASGAATMWQRAAETADAHQVVMMVADALGPHRWSGQAAQGFHTQMLGRRSQLEGMVERAEQAARAIDGYVQAVEEIAVAARPAREALNQARETMWLLYSDPSWAGGPGPCSATPLAAQPLEVQQELHRRRQDLQWQASLEESRALEVLAALHTERNTADDGLRGTLAELDGSPVARRSYEAMTARGYSGAELTQASPQDIAAVMADMYARLADSEGRNGSLADELRAMNLAWGGDQQVVAAMLAPGGIGLVGLARGIDALGRTPGADGAAATAATRAGLTRLRASVARISRTWDDDEVARQVGLLTAAARQVELVGSGLRELLGGGIGARYGMDATGLAAGIGYLFADPLDAPIGEGFTVALATELDDLERTTGRPLARRVPRRHRTARHRRRPGQRSAGPSARNARRLPRCCPRLAQRPRTRHRQGRPLLPGPRLLGDQHR